MDHHDTIHLEFLVQFLIQLHKSYSSHIDHNSSEDAFNQHFVWPYLDIIAKMINIDGCNSDFVQGQPYLESMSRQLKAVNLYVDDKNQCKSDGLIKLFGLNKLELLLVETFGCFSNKDEEKIKLGHHKGLYRALTMLKCIADDYAYASLKSFTLVKVFFLQAAAQFNIKIKPDFRDKECFLPEFIQFCWKTEYVMEESIKNIVALKEEHRKIRAKYRYCSDQPKLLNDVRTPIMLKLTKEEDGLG